MLSILEKQRVFFKSGKTINYQFRLSALKKLRETIINEQSTIIKALQLDLNKSETESYMTEIGLVISDLNYQIKHLKKNMKNKMVKTPLAQFKSKSFTSPYPYGNVLIISPWNYPILLTLEPLAGAIAAGNTVIIKPSEDSPNCSKVIKEIISNCFPNEYVAVIEGDYKVASSLLKEKWDYIFFTGSTNIGKIVYQAASQNLTPVTLELGGKSPVIVEKTAKLEIAAKRIVFGKFINCGQTCVAPDYILIDEEIKDKFIEYLIKYINILYPDYLSNDDYGKIINEKHFYRLLNYLNEVNVIYGGQNNISDLKIEPTIVEVTNFNAKIMNEEIFGPILPIYVYKNFNEIYDLIAINKEPLALYLFTENKAVQSQILNKIQFGGGCINDTIIHLATNNLGFGGVGKSGIGSYHGKLSFKTFSHYRSIVKKTTYLDLPFRYTPYTKLKNKLIKLFLK